MIFKWIKQLLHPKNHDIDFEEGYFEEDDYEDEKPVVRFRSSIAIKDFVTKHYIPQTFADALNEYLHKKHTTTAMIYRRCFVDRKLISKITTNKQYHPSKETVFALCFGLKLTYKESQKFLELAGYTFSPNSKYDLIIQYLLKHRIYQIDEVNDILYDNGCPCFGE